MALVYLHYLAKIERTVSTPTGNITFSSLSLSLSRARTLTTKRSLGKNKDERHLADASQES